MADHVVFYRFWADAHPDFPIDQFDNTPHAKLAEELEAYGRNWIDQRFGSVDAWHEHRAKRRLMSLEDSRRKDNGTLSLPGPGSRPSKTASAPVETMESLLAAVRDDPRSMLHQLIDEPSAIRKRRGGPRIVSVGRTPLAALDEVTMPTVYFFRCDSAEDARLTQQFMQHKHGTAPVAPMGERGSRVTARYGCMSLDDHDHDTCVDALDGLEYQAGSDLELMAERGLRLSRAASGSQGDEPEQSDAVAEDPMREQRTAKVPDHVHRALKSFDWICALRPDIIPAKNRAQSKKQWQYIKDGSCPAYQEGDVSLRLPAFDTWTRYIRAGQQARDGSRRTPRGGRRGRSIAHRDEI